MTLKLVRQLADLVEQERRAVGSADQTGAFRHAWIRIISGIAEELGVDEPGGQGRRVPGDEQSTCTA